MTEPTPTVRAQELGEELRQLRETAGLSLQDAAARIDASASKLSRIETGRRPAPLEDVTALLAIYGVTGRKRRELLDLTRESGERGWWQKDKPDFPERQRTLISLESRADRIVNFEGMVIPGLLQTGEYTRALMAESGMVPPEEIEERMVTRLKRHSVLMRRGAPEFLALIDELVLHRVVGGVDVLRRQLEHLRNMAGRPNISVRILPNSQAHAGSNGSFSMLQQLHGPTVVFLENLTSSLFVEERQEIERYRQALRKLLLTAQDPTQSEEAIASLAIWMDTEASST